jgi:hypothetical protein
MTEDQWVACGDVEAMLGHLRGAGTAGDRKLRLFGCACCRQVWGRLTDPRSRKAAEVAEQLADGAATEAMRSEAAAAADEAQYAVWLYAPEKNASESPSWLASLIPGHLVGEEPAIPATLDALSKVEPTGRAQAAALLRDIFGNPFRPLVLAPSLLTPPILSLADAAYHGRELPSGHLSRDRLLVLADALEEVGCEDAALLEHLRSEGAHVRGCWAVDVVLGKG